MARRTWVLAVTVLVVLGLAGLAFARSVTRVTGGGQYLTDGVGADDTLTFEVQQTSGGSVFGEVEFDPTDSQSGPVIAQGRWHGRVVCADIDVQNGTANFAGFKQATSSQGETEGFEIFLKDNPPQGGDDDIIALNQNDDGECDGEFGPQTELFRGEAQITTNGR